ncbi:MAG: hypothetical protein ACJASM_000897 [Salibacteraceae bacterium]|jgi:hypothetical protein
MIWKLVIFVLCVSFKGNTQVTDTLVVGYTKSVYLIFNSENIDYDNGNPEDVGVKRGKKKILVNALGADFEESNLLVDVDGTLYLFIVVFSDQDSPNRRYVYNYTGTSRMVKGGVEDFTGKVSRVGEAVFLPDTKTEDSIIENYKMIADSLLSVDKAIMNRGVVRYKLGIYLRDLVLYDGKYFMCFEAVNRSNIAYDIDYVDFWVRSSKKRRLKKETFQEVRITVEETFEMPLVFQGNKSEGFVLMVDKFVLTENKKLVCEFWEYNGSDLNVEGGRKVNFELFFKDILSVKLWY